jgi:hypothetical protein
MPFVTGLDLGKLSDHSALAVLEQTRRPVPGQPPEGRTTETHYFVGHLVRFPKRTPYIGRAGAERGIVEQVKDLMSRAQLQGTPLAIDQTGVGVAVVDFFRRANLGCLIRPITITTGAAITRVPAENGWHVPKKELVSTLEVLLQNRRLSVARGLPDGDALKEELSNFQMKISKAAHESFGAWREGEHDDLVLAVMLAIWLAEHTFLGPDCGIMTPMSRDGQRGNCRMANRPPGGVW